jgi:hypothetical protein
LFKVVVSLSYWKIVSPQLIDIKLDHIELLGPRHWVTSTSKQKLSHLSCGSALCTFPWASRLGFPRWRPRVKMTWSRAETDSGCLQHEHKVKGFSVSPWDCAVIVYHSRTSPKLTHEPFSYSAHFIVSNISRGLLPAKKQKEHLMQWSKSNFF